ncbi:uncharacterized protein LOC121424699 [Lytechinus variegatus]|uniref:uncharacterized protein LOC121424699 n=1 Tax=Lytechinus variegatus TaxID=7654 RepID=UPI001BB1150A|nr:uncharacterized protein LOC121424699 [Lytechinus variegatus]
MEGRHHLPTTGQVTKWFVRFLTRNPRLVFWKSQPIGKERAIVTPGRINRWFKESEAYMYLEEVGAMSILFEGRRMFNGDESGFPLGRRKGTRVLAEKGSKIVHEVRNSDKTQITVLATMNVSEISSLLSLSFQVN